MSVATVTRIDAARIDWLGRADRIAADISEAAVRHDAGESFVSEIARNKPSDDNLACLVGELENAFAAAAMALEQMIHTAETAQPGKETTSRIMIGRTLAGQAAMRTVERAMEVAGGATFYRRIGLERAFRDVQGARFHPLQEKPQLRYTGRLALGLDIDG